MSTSPSSRWLKLLVVALLMALLQACSATMLRTTCKNPRVSNFGAPTSHVVVLPHGYAGADESRMQYTLRLNELARLQALHAAVKMPRTQVTFVEGAGDDPACDIEEVYDRVVDERTGLFWRRAYHSAVFVWGDVYASAQGLEVQSQLRVYWNGQGDRDLRLRRAGKSEGEVLEFRASLPTDTVALPVFAVSEQAIGQLQRGLQQSLAGGGAHSGRSSPPDGQPCSQLPGRFSVERWQPPWLQVMQRDRSACWMRIDEDALEPQVTMRHVLFGQAVAAYLSHRVSPDPGALRMMRESIAALRRQMGSEGRSDADSVMAWTELMEATASWTDAGAVQPGWELRGSGSQRDSQARRRSAASLKKVADLLPNSADAQNLAALGALQLCCDGPQASAEVQAIHGLFERARLLQPASPDALANRANWYRLLQALPPALLPFPAEELEGRVQQALAEQKSWQRFRSR